MRVLGNILIVIGLAGATLGLLMLIPVFVMNVGAAWERTPQLGLFRLYSVLYYADHPQVVEALSCSKGRQESINAPGYEPALDPSTGRQLYRSALDCLQPKTHRTFVGWCPAILELVRLCASVAYPVEVRQLPGFEDGLTRFATSPCDVNEARGWELLRLIYNPKEAPSKSMPNAICLHPRMLAVHFVDNDASSQHSRIYFPSAKSAR
jgi:hypothetical protein